MSWEFGRWGLFEVRGPHFQSSSVSGKLRKCPELILGDSMIILYLQVLQVLTPSTIWLQASLFLASAHPAKLRDIESARAMRA